MLICRQEYSNCRQLYKEHFHSLRGKTVILCGWQCSNFANNTAKEALSVQYMNVFFFIYSSCIVASEAQQCPGPVSASISAAFLGWHSHARLPMNDVQESSEKTSHSQWPTLPVHKIKSGSNLFSLRLPLWLESRLLSQPLSFVRHSDAHKKRPAPLPLTTSLNHKWLCFSWVICSCFSCNRQKITPTTGSKT